MAVTPEALSELYPHLFHMAELGSWNNIKRDGLLSTSALLDLYKVSKEERIEIETKRRPESRTIADANLGSARIRDQKPLHESKLQTSLTDCTILDWHRMLNSRVFFWLHQDRLKTLLGAREYREKPHDVITADTLSMATAHQNSITLSPMNSGNTVPFAWERGLSTFRRMAEYPFEERLKRGPYYTVVELAVDRGVPDIKKYTQRVDVLCYATTDEVILLGTIEKAQGAPPSPFRNATPEEMRRYL